MKAKPFTINISDETLLDLKQRLESTRWPADADDWSNGTSLDYMKELTEYWLHKYDWRHHEAGLNKLAHFTVEIDGIPVHFVHEKSHKANAPAIILTHGWPDSFYRFHKVIPLLTEEFDVIVPSLPGFVFSGNTAQPSTKVADLWATLMTKVLGYTKFMAAGGDLGTPVVKALLKQHPKLVTVAHLTDVGYPTGQEDPTTLSKAEQEFINQASWWSMTEGAYLFVHGNKPQSIAYGLNDSPAALAAWMVSFVNGNNQKSVADGAFGSRDELLTNIMLYWVTQTGGSSIAMYREDAKATYGGGWEGNPEPPQKSTIPTAVAVFPGDLAVPREWAERDLNVQRFEVMPRGGHFAAIEQPELYAQDVITSYRALVK